MSRDFRDKEVGSGGLVKARKRSRRREEAERMPSSTFAFWSVILNGIFAVIFTAAVVAFVWLIVIGWWASPLELLVAFVLIAVAVVGALFFADGIRRDVAASGWSWRTERRNVRRRARRSPGGRESFASQRFTGNRRRRQ